MSHFVLPESSKLISRKILMSTVWKNEKFSLTKKIRKLNSLVTFLVRKLISRNFCEKSVRVNARNFITVLMQYSQSTVWKFDNFSAIQILREINCYVNS